jgi:hypothetical protein
MSKRAYLTKSRYVAGLQCLRRLWLNVHEPADFDDAEPGSVQDIGLEIGRRAHLLFPGGVLVEQMPWEHAEAVAQTAVLMAERKVPAIFEAAFEHSGIRVRVDILERLSGGYWGLREVKSSSEAKDHQYDDVAVQFHVLRNSGVSLSSVEILHVDKQYVRGKKEIAWSKFFARADVKKAAVARLDGIEERLKLQFSNLALRQAPKVEPEKHCHDPYTCEHWEQCTATKPDDWVYYLPHLKAPRRNELKALGVESISAIPEDFKLSDQQKIIRSVTCSGKAYVSPDLSGNLSGFGPPAYYLDFETFAPAIPLYPGTKPYQTIQFQWSLHCVDAEGKISHTEFLAKGDTDPRRSFAETLISALEGSKWPIIVYSPYERTQLKALGKELPDLAKPLDGIVARLADLLPVVRGGVYHPDFDFSFSIKTAAPALCPDVTYKDLPGVADGGAASTAFWLLASRRAEPNLIDETRKSLLAYCKRDTWAMVRLHQALSKLAVR